MARKNTFTIPSKQHGFSLFEIVVVVLLVGVLMIVAIDRMLQLQIESERVSVQHIIGVLNSAVNLQAAELIVDRGLNSIRSLENTNPLSYLSELPHNYSGLKSDKDANQHDVASWYYDPQQNILVYKVKNRNYFETSLVGTARIRLKIVLLYKEEISHGRNSKIRGISVKSLDAYRWKSSRI